MTKLRLAFATQESARFACLNWHYSKKIPTSKLVRIGVWEEEKFVGVVLFGVGASARVHEQFKVSRYEICELVRVALREHQTPCSRIIAIALRLLRKSNPGLRVCVSFADPRQGHHGGIYQAGNWIYTGRSASQWEYFFKGDWRHVTNIYKRARSLVDELPKRKTPGKHRYVMPFDDDMRRLASLDAKEYPKRESAPEAEASKRPDSIGEKAVQVRPGRSKVKTRAKTRKIQGEA